MHTGGMGSQEGRLGKAVAWEDGIEGFEGIINSISVDSLYIF